MIPFMKASSLYIHVPFCNDKCDYCIFYSIKPTAKKVDFYLKRLREELITWHDSLREIDTLFIGGGTPTLLGKHGLHSLCEILKECVPLASIKEITLEANPETLTPEMLHLILSSPINRLSIGIQSFNKKMRTVLGRQGNLELLEDAIAVLNKNSFSNISFDFIYGIPEQKLEDLEKDIRRAINFGISHLSAYALSIEEASRLASTNNRVLLDDDSMAEMWHTIEAILSSHSNLRRYEISNYAAEGKECLHNTFFWQGRPYIGCGPAAVSTLCGKRFQNANDFETWAQGRGRTIVSISPEQQAREMLILGLRTLKGASLQELHNATDFDIETAISATLEELEEENLIERKQAMIVPTRRGLIFHDEIGARLI